MAVMPALAGIHDFLPAIQKSFPGLKNVTM